MASWNYTDLARHIDHRIVCVSYGSGINVAVECVTCNEVIVDFDCEEEEG